MKGFFEEWSSIEHTGCNTCPPTRSVEVRAVTHCLTVPRKPRRGVSVALRWMRRLRAVLDSLWVRWDNG